MAKMSFWLSLALLIYGYVGHAVLAAVVGWLRGGIVRQLPITPPVSVIIAAYNEEDVLARQLENLLSLDYPPGALEILVASDGSTDDTVGIARAYASRGVRVLDLPRRGKMHALNAAVLEAGGEVLVFTDANTFFEPPALRRLARNFADQTVGGVAGSKVCTVQADGDSSGRGERLYWSYEQWLKKRESLTGSIVSADGAIYAIRRELYRPCPDPAVTDDFAISTAVIEQGLRLVFESEARAFEAVVPVARCEFSRKVRIMSRGLRGVLLRKHLLNPFRYGFYAVTLFSHKLLRRLLSCVLLILGVATALCVHEGTLYLIAAGAQAMFYALAGIGCLGRNARLGRESCFYVPFFYCLGNAAALVALVSVLSGQRTELWQPQRHGARA
jgi:cellulose synthase/poly-beta-1,6-N-acetylglucosamine synthase-like glycosyltransferase